MLFYSAMNLSAKSAAVLHATGNPPRENFSPEKYGGYPQNWAVVQDHRGIMYIGNGDDGVLEFDGDHWRHIEIPRQRTVSSLAVDVHGRVYVGCVDEFGYLAPDATGQLRYVSLLDRVDPKDKGFSDVWITLVLGGRVYFATRSRLFGFDGAKLRVWPARSQIHLAFKVGQELYIEEIGRGFEKLIGDQLVPVEGSERFANDNIYATVPWDDQGTVLIGSRQASWTLLDDKTYRPWPTQVDAQLKTALIYAAPWLSDGQLAVATLQGGVLQHFGWEDVVNLADQCLSRAKRDGPNRWMGVAPTHRTMTATSPENLPVDLDVLVSDGYLSVVTTEMTCLLS